MKTNSLVEHRSARRLVLYALLVVVLVLPTGHGQEVDVSRFNALKPYRTPSRRFVILGPDTLDNIEAGRWAETMGGRVEELIAGPLPLHRREVRIVIRPSESTATGTVTVADCAPLALTQRLESGRLVQRMVIPAAECLAEERVRIAFCRLLIEGFLSSSRSSPEPVQVPRWITVGLARNLWRGQRGEDAFTMVGRWRQGSVLPLADWLSRSEAEWDTFTDAPVSALLMAWLVAPPDGYARFCRVLGHLDRGAAIGADLLAVELLAEGAEPADLEVAWDGWIMRQQRKVFRPGMTPPDVLKQLSSELLLYPGAFGIPLASDMERGAGFAALIDRRKSDWIPAFCRMKLASLRALALGRGPAVKETVERYGAFLVALERGKRSGRLRRLLEKAETALHELEFTVLDAADGMDHGSKDTNNAGR